MDMWRREPKEDKQLCTWYVVDIFLMATQLDKRGREGVLGFEKDKTT